eukprot:COSAG05_NODE_277_length_12336_cov_419.763668_9_plen_98_part_00
MAAIPDSLNDSAWISHLCLLICAFAVLIFGAVYFRFIFVPLAMAWFFTFLLGPILDVRSLSTSRRIGIVFSFHFLYAYVEMTGIYRISWNFWIYFWR